VIKNVILRILLVMALVVVGLVLKIALSNPVLPDIDTSQSLREKDSRQPPDRCARVSLRG